MRFTYTPSSSIVDAATTASALSGSGYSYWPGCEPSASNMSSSPKAAFDRHRLALALPPTQNDELHEVQAVMRLGTALDVREPPGALRVYPARERVAQWRGPHAGAHRGESQDRAPHQRALAADGVAVVLVWAPGAADDARHPRRPRLAGEDRE